MMAKHFKKLYLTIFALTTCATASALQQFISRAYRTYIKRTPDNIWMQVVQSWPMKRDKLKTVFQQIYEKIQDIPTLIDRQHRLQFPLELAQLARKNPEQFQKTMIALEKENKEVTKSLTALLSTPEELQKIAKKYQELHNEIQQYNINEISPIYEKTPLQYAIVNEDYEAALGLIKVSEFIKQSLSKNIRQQEQEFTDEQMITLLPFISINPLAPSPSGRTMLEYAFLALEKNLRPAKLAYHLEAPQSTYSQIMTYLSHAFHALQLPTEGSEKDGMILEALDRQLKQILAGLKQQFESMKEQIKNHIAILQQKMQQHERLYEKAPGEYKTHIEQLNRTQDVLQIIISKLTCVEENIGAIKSLPKILIAYRLIESLLESKLLEQTNKVNLILLKHWFTYYCLMIAPAPGQTPLLEQVSEPQ
jgi:hypothetical protein